MLALFSALLAVGNPVRESLFFEVLKARVATKRSAIPVETRKLFAFPPESRSLSHRNTVRNHTGMVFGFRPESRSPSTGFHTQSGMIPTRRSN
jgi:hypothetical protein